MTALHKLLKQQIYFNFMGFTLGALTNKLILFSRLTLKQELCMSENVTLFQF